MGSFTLPEALTLYFFSGTGNARNVAYWFAEVAKEAKIPAETIDIAMIDRKKVIKERVFPLRSFFQLL